MFILISGSSGTYPEKLINRAEKRAAKIFKDYDIHREPILADDPEQFFGQGDTLFRLVDKKGGPRGFLVISSAMGRFEKFDFMMVYDLDLFMKDLVILVYRSEYGYQVSARGWLRQFLNNPPQTSYAYGQNIDAVSGATISGRSLTSNVNRLNRGMISLSK